MNHGRRVVGAEGVHGFDECGGRGVYGNVGEFGGLSAQGLRRKWKG